MVSTADSGFRIVINDSAHAAQAELVAIQTLTISQKLDQAGELSFTCPAGDPAAVLIGADSLFDVYDEQDGFLGTFVFKTSQVSDNQGVGTLTVSAFDTLILLTYNTVAFHRVYTGVSVATILADLEAIATGWTFTAPDLSSTSITFDGENVLAALIALAKQAGQHVRLLTGGYAAEIGLFGADSGVTALQLVGNLTTPPLNPALAMVDTLSKSTDGQQIINTIIALGGGQGEAQTTMQGATAGTYPLLTAANADASLYYYIQDPTSVALYGVRTRIMVFQTTRPTANTAAAKVDAANVLKVWAESQLLKYKNPLTHYDVGLRSLPMSVQLGDTVRLMVNQARDGVSYLSVDEQVYILSITRTRAASGDRRTQVTLSNVTTYPPSDSRMMVQAVETQQAASLHPQPGVVAYTATWLDYAQEDVGFGVKNAEFKVPINDMFTTITRVELHFKTKTSWSFFQTDTVTPAAGAPFHAFWYMLRDNQFPSDITLSIDGVDQTSALGGPWNIGGGTGAIDVTVDVTDIILNAVGGLYGDHDVVFSVGTLTGPVDMPGYAATSNQPGASRGYFELSLLVLGVAQAIKP